MRKLIARAAVCVTVLVCIVIPARAELTDTVDAYWRGAYERAFEDFHLYASQNHTVAQAYLAVMYRVGQGTFRNFRFAEGWKERVDRFRPGDYERLLAFVQAKLRKSPNAADRARANRERAQKALAREDPDVERGHLYYLGLGVPQDYVEAARWYYAAARRGDAAGQGYLGIMYLWGHGTGEDAVEAYKWLTLAFRGAKSAADKRRFRVIRDQLASLMTEEMLEEGRAAVRDFKPETD